jgi:hypothetical protein
VGYGKDRRQESESVCKMIVWKPEGKLSADRYKISWEHNIKMDLIYRGCGGRGKFIYLRGWNNRRLLLREDESFLCSRATAFFSIFFALSVLLQVPYLLCLTSGH